MPNPTITPWGGATTTYTVNGSSFAAVDIRLSDIENSPASLILTAPNGATVHAIRDPGAWSDAGTALLTGGAWVGGPLLLGGQWNVQITPGGAVTDPATIIFDDPDGTNPTGTLRLVFRGLTGQLTIEKAGGIQSIDRVLANPSILNAGVTSVLPVKELDAVTLGATTQATQSFNPMPSPALSALPPIVSAWNPQPANPAAVGNFMSAGNTASFDAPAAYSNLVLNFRLRSVHDLDGTGLASMTNPGNEEILPVTVNTVTHGMVLVLDRSGSMGSNFGPGVSRWDAAVRAAHAWLDLFRAFRPGNLHKAGIVTFEHDTCGWTPATATDVTLRDPSSGAVAMSMSALSGFGDVAQLNLGNVDSCTPIGDALIKAWEAIGSGLLGGSGGKKASVLLLTDGYENSGRVTIAANQGAAATTFAIDRATSGHAFANNLIGNRLFTLAVGQQVDQQRLNNLGAGFYHMSTDATQMLPAFVQMIGSVLEAQEAMPIVVGNDPDNPTNALYYPASAGEQQIAFLVPWDSATDELSVGWRVGSSGAFTAVNPAGSGVQYYQRQGHGLMVASIQTVTGQALATEWRVRHMVGNVAQPLNNAEVSCIIDLMVKAEPSFDKPQYFIGDEIRLNCRISHGGGRVTGATIGIDVARPGEGLGTFLATNAERYKATKEPPTGQSADPPKGKGQMHATLLNIFGMNDLPVVTPPDFKLHDDGAHGDGAADDGDYSGVFTDTVKEGTYTFRYRIEGKLPDGSNYSRMFVRSTWVGVKPDPGLLNAVWKSVEVPNGVGSLVTFTPKTKSGEYLGPFQSDVIEITVSRGKFDGDLVDNLDGSYSQKVIHEDGRDPIVSIDIQGVRMDPTGPGLGGSGTLGGDGKNCWKLWVAACRCTFRAILRALGIIK
ncbi:MAG TPA: vWA domain-containing protein [Allosphingosinicella sp.]|jgi:hypothetical protein